MADLGTMSLLLALALATYAGIGSVAGARLGSGDLVMSARRSSYMAGIALAVAAGALVYAFGTHDFSIEYVRTHSDLAQSQRFTWVAMYAGNEGSLLYITAMLTAMSIVAIYVTPKRLEPSRPYIIAILMGIVVFFLAVMLTLGLMRMKVWRITLPSVVARRRLSLMDRTLLETNRTPRAFIASALVRKSRSAFSSIGTSNGSIWCGVTQWPSG